MNNGVSTKDSKPIAQALLTLNRNPRAQIAQHFRQIGRPVNSRPRKATGYKVFTLLDRHQVFEKLAGHPAWLTGAELNRGLTEDREAERNCKHNSAEDDFMAIELTNKKTMNNRPSQEQISARAYQIFVERGCPEGRDLEHWLEAEAQLSADSQTNGATQQRQPAIAQSQPIQQTQPMKPSSASIKTPKVSNRPAAGRRV